MDCYELQQFNPEFQLVFAQAEFPLEAKKSTDTLTNVVIPFQLFELILKLLQDLINLA